MESVNYVKYNESVNFLESPHPLFKVGASLSPYAGCSMGCVYCPFGFEKKIGVKTDFLYNLDRKLSGSVCEVHLGLGAACEPYCEREKEFNITRNSVELIAKYGFPLQIFTKSPLILRDIDIFKPYSERGLLAVSISVMSLDDAVNDIFEPAAAPCEERAVLIRELNANEVFAGAVLSPIIPYITDSEGQLDETFDRLKRSGAQYILPSVLSAGSPAAFNNLKEKVLERYPNIYHRIDKLYENSRFPAPTYTARINDLLESLSLKYGIPLSIPTEKDETLPQGIRQELLK